MRNNEEEKIQAEIVKAIRHAGVFCFMVPNDLAKGNAVATGQAVAMGLYPGVSDLVCIDREGRAYFLEIKTLTGVLSASQVRFREKCLSSGWPYEVGRSVDEAMEIIRMWGLDNTPAQD